jgi:hypothetical protein
MARRKAEDFIMKFLEIFQKGQLQKSIENLADTMQRLGSNVSSLNSHLVQQNNAVTESIRNAKEQTRELKEELRELNKETARATPLFESLERSSHTMEWLTTVITIFTLAMVAFSVYNMLKDINCPFDTGCTSGQYLHLLIISLLFSTLMLVIIIILDQRAKRKRIEGLKNPSQT